MGSKSRTKGATGEREFASSVEDLTGHKLRRVLEQWRSGGHDLDGDGFPFAVEVKRHRVVLPANLAVWWNQAETQAIADGRPPALAYRGDRRPWRVMVPLSVLNADLTHAPGIEWAADLSLQAFCHLITEHT